MLAGLIAGGGNTDDLSATAVVPLDEPAAVMRYGSYKLNEHHELW